MRNEEDIQKLLEEKNALKSLYTIIELMEVREKIRQRIKEIEAEQ